MDIVERLRTVDISWSREGEWCAEAADEIEKLREERSRLREALKPFAEKYLWPDDSGFADELRSDEDWDEGRNEEEVDDVWLKRKWIRQARAALKETE